MPIEKSYADAILGTFRNMVQDCKDKQLFGEPFEKMTAAMDTMETLALQMDDFTAFSTKLGTEGLFTAFSTAYGAVLASEAQTKYAATGGYNDQQLLTQTMEAYKNSLQQLNGYPGKEKLRSAIQQVIDLGESGINYPCFLRLLIEKGLDKAMEGQVISRDALVRDVQWAQELVLPVYERRNKNILARYDELAASAAFQVPDTMIFEMERFKIESGFQPLINKYEAIVSRWNKLLELLHDWIDAHTSFASRDNRYVSANGMAETLQNIAFKKDCYPGFFAKRMELFTQYFALIWEDIFTHESFAAERKATRCMYTDAYIDFLQEVYLQCTPAAVPAAAFIEKAENLYHNKKVFIPL